MLTGGRHYGSSAWCLSPSFTKWWQAGFTRRFVSLHCQEPSPHTLITAMSSPYRMASSLERNSLKYHRQCGKKWQKKAHSGHLGINSCLHRACELVYWPGMSSDIQLHVESCKFSDRQPGEPLTMKSVPDHPFCVVATDILTLKWRDYLVFVDTYSNFIEVDLLHSATSSEVIQNLKTHFAKHGSPETLMSDNGTQYMSSEFQRFTQAWNFKHQTSSPGDSQSNGAAEAAVKSV